MNLRSARVVAAALFAVAVLETGCGANVEAQARDARGSILELARALVNRDDDRCASLIVARECYGNDNPTASEMWDKGDAEYRKGEMKGHCKWLRTALKEAGITDSSGIDRLDKALEVKINSRVQGTGMASFRIAGEKGRAAEIVWLKIQKRDDSWKIVGYSRKFAAEK